MTILIKGGRVLDPMTETDAVMDVYVRDGIITRREKNIKAEADKIIDASGRFVMPGFIDMHVHLRDPGFTQKGDVITESRSAARGGYTTVLAMPNTKPVVDNADVVNYVHNKAEAADLVHVLQVGAITKGQQGKELADIEDMAAAGSPAISEDGKSVMNSALARDAMVLAKKCGIPVLAHCEDNNLVCGGVVNADANAEKENLPGITNSVEDIIIARDIMLAKDTGVHLHLCHCSTKNSVAMVKHAKLEHTSVSAEVCPHHFTLTSDDMLPGDTNYKMNPPLRMKEDVEALKQGLADGIMEVIATDHAPHTADEKNNSMLKAPFGIVGMETAAALAYTELVEGGYLTPLQMAEKMSSNPARILGLNRGTLAEESPADIVIFDPEASYKIDKNKFWSKAKNTPFDGRGVKGRVEMTIVDGRIVYDREEE